MLEGILSKRQIEAIERNKFLSQEYRQEMKDTYYYYKDDIYDCCENVNEFDRLLREYQIEDYK